MEASIQIKVITHIVTSADIPDDNIYIDRNLYYIADTAPIWKYRDCISLSFLQNMEASIFYSVGLFSCKTDMSTTAK